MKNLFAAIAILVLGVFTTNAAVAATACANPYDLTLANMKSPEIIGALAAQGVTVSGIVEIPSGSLAEAEALFQDSTSIDLSKATRVFIVHMQHGDEEVYGGGFEIDGCLTPQPIYVYPTSSKKSTI